EYGAAFKEVATLAITMAAVLVVLPKVVAILMEGLIPISEGARSFLQKRFPGRDMLIGLDAAVVIGHPTNMAIALICVPIVLQLFQPGTPGFWMGLAAAIVYALVWWWVRGEIRARYAVQIAEKEAAMKSAATSEKEP